ncbi:hypothetical protein QTJ16_000004 [Diplocarpon rosae]|uniref:ribonuclease T1 n=1 Tax=Diplocarpon rosae TaxID=946125 RepID=A0AAD9T5Z7_9HELO|nr:hypothetical protein QTJ16_000004 [Diplocarpon rosae]
MYFSIANLFFFAILLETAFSTEIPVFHAETRTPSTICDGVLYNSAATEACRSLAWFYVFKRQTLGTDYPHIYKNFEKFEFSPDVQPPWYMFPMVENGFWELGMDPGPVRCVIGMGGFLAGSIYHKKDSNKFEKCQDVLE